MTASWLVQALLKLRGVVRVATNMLEQLQFCRWGYLVDYGAQVCVGGDTPSKRKKDTATPRACWISTGTIGPPERGGNRRITK